jgi:hypothetical protein
VILIWHDYLLDILTEEFGSEEGVIVGNVVLLTTRPNGEDVPQQQQQQQQDQQQHRELFVNGSATFRIDEQTVDWKDFSNRVQMVLEDATTSDQLQRALVDAGNTTTTIVVAAPTVAPTTNATTTKPPPDGEQSDESRRRPTNVELVIGFTILFATILSLFYWAVLLWKKRVKNVRRRQLEAVRQQTYRNAMSQAVPPPLPKMAPMPQTLTSDDEDYEMVMTPRINSPIAFPAAAVGTNTDGESTNSSSTSVGGGNVHDPFALELQRAVSLDRQAWEEYRKRMEAEGGEQHQQRGATEHYEGGSEGVEVSFTSFPYGDEEVRSNGPTPRQVDSSVVSPYSNLPPIRETTRLIGRKTPASTSRRLPTPPSSRERTLNEYSPYGDRVSDRVGDRVGERMAERKAAERTGRAATGSNRRVPLSQSWDNEDEPVVDDRKPAQYSFLHPLRRRDIEADIPNDTDPSSSNDTPTSGAVREPIDVTTVDSNVDEGLSTKENDPSAEPDAEKDWPTSLTETMLREVEYIAQFVRRYEQKHNKRSTTTKKSRPGELYDDSGQVIDEATLKQEVGQEYKRGALRPVANSAVLEEGRMVPSRVLPRVERSRSPLVSEDADQDGRLGIGKFTIGRPMSNRSTRFVNKPSQDVQFRDQVSDLSPIQSDEEQQESSMANPPHYQGRLSSLRSNESMLDITPTGEFEPDSRHVSDDGTAPNDTALASRRQRPVEPLTIEQVTERPRRSRKKVSPRSQNMAFNSIRSIFEAKDTSPIVPPNDSVRAEPQYELYAATN